MLIIQVFSGMVKKIVQKISCLHKGYQQQRKYIFGINSNTNDFLQLAAGLLLALQQAAELLLPLAPQGDRAG
jgi:hypothetical protein